MSVKAPSSSTAAAFYTTLARGLDDLDRSLASSAFLSLSSLRAALALLRASLHLPGGAAWLDEYMDEASRLCDACRALRLGAAATEGYAASAAQLASFLLQQPPSSPSRQVARAISVCRREAMALKEENRALVEARAEPLALRLAEGVPADAKLGGFNGFHGVLCATRMLTSFLLTVLSWGVLHYWPDPPAAAASGPPDCAAYFGAAFASALCRAQQRAAAEAARSWSSGHQAAASPPWGSSPATGGRWRGRPQLSAAVAWELRAPDAGRSGSGEPAGAAGGADAGVPDTELLSIDAAVSLFVLCGDRFDAARLFRSGPLSLRAVDPKLPASPRSSSYNGLRVVGPTSEHALPS